MPLPIPRWVVSSPIHMMRTVPATSVPITSSTRLSGKPGSSTTLGAFCPPSSVAPLPRPNRKVRPVPCSSAMPMVR